MPQVNEPCGPWIRFDDTWFRLTDVDHFAVSYIDKFKKWAITAVSRSGAKYRREGFTSGEQAHEFLRGCFMSGTSDE